MKFYAPAHEGLYYPRPYPHSPKHTREELLASYPSSSSSSGSPRAHHQTYTSMRRSRTVGGSPYAPEYDYDCDFDRECDCDPSDADPCVRLPHTYAWVLEQQIADMVQQNEDTVRWVHEQRARDTSLREHAALRLLAGRRGSHSHSHSHSHTALDARVVAAAAWVESAERERRWKRWEREAEFTVTIQDELRRLQAHRRDAERHRAAYERRKRAEEEKERMRREREREREREAGRKRRQEVEREAGRRYQARWGELLSSEGTLGFRDIPWPVFSQPKAFGDLSPAKVAMFVLSPLHPGETKREKVRNALRRWHPDRFGRLAGRIEETEKEAIEEGVGIVARCLNDLLERESQ
ncbi:hypothetical protein GSI_03626 [Ganoderma sinense ZZ0214-1]|uniref:Uncharacterized protein n=1 Tax=Ganoderma sinense ZZ0214-1 TaxID=1077348 RepID=A0A2G8SJH4_9APHY|nr:hypothetical protein GSI_03626 [Ganoderma sinense ZZ0214-1]